MAPRRRPARTRAAPARRAGEQARPLGRAGPGPDRPRPRRPHRRRRAARPRRRRHHRGARARGRRRRRPLLGRRQGLRRLRRRARHPPRADQCRGRGSGARRRLPHPERERLPRPAEGLDGPLQRRRDALPGELSRLATNARAGGRAKRLENLAPGRRTVDRNSQRELSVDKSARRWPERAMSPAARLARIEGLAARVAALEAGNAAFRVRVGMLEAENAALKADNAALREKLGRPPKTLGNSGTPPSRGHKASGAAEARRKGKVHAGAHRPLHPEPTRRRDVFAEHCPHCRAALAAAGQAPLQAYDRIDIPRITPDVTRVTLHGGTCPCCHGRFKAAPPAGLEPGSPFGPNLRALVLYLRFGQAIPFARLARLLADLFGLSVSEGALAAMLADSAPAFAIQGGGIPRALLCG